MVEAAGMQLFLKKDNLPQVFSRKFLIIFDRSPLKEHLWPTASGFNLS